MGGDRGPEEVVAGALAAASDVLAPVIVGPSSLDTHGLERLEAERVIAMDEKPTEAVRAKPDSSLVVACRAVGERTADAVVSAGNTGAMLAACLLELRRLPGGRRGANAEARPEDLLQFAHMGTVFAEEILGVRDPEVRLLSIGEEPEKGDHMRREAHALLAASDLPFAGNTEGRDLLVREGRVVITDGFTGNVTLKLLEGTIRAVLDGFREEIEATPRGKVGGLLIRPAARRLRRRLDPDTYGGAYLRGLRGLAVIAHGNSSRRAIENAVRLAARGVERDVVGRLAQRLGDTVLESAPSTTPTPT